MQIYNSPESARHSREDVSCFHTFYFTVCVHSGSLFESRIQRVSHQLILILTATLTSIFGPPVERGEADDRHVRVDIYGVPPFSVPRRRPRPMRRDLDEWRTGRDAIRCDAMRCGRSVPKYQITGVWTELLARAAPGRVARVSSRNSRKVAQG